MIAEGQRHRRIVTASFPRNVADRRTKFGAGHRPLGLPNITPVADRSSGSRPRPSDGQPLTGSQPLTGKVVRLYLLWGAGENPTSSPADSGLLNLLDCSMKKPDVCLHTDESLGLGVLRVAEDLIDYIVGSDQHPKQEEGEYIHHVRTTIKRLRALLRLIRPVVGETFFNRENARLRNAGHRLAVARDTEVARETLKALPVSDDPEKQAVAAALAGLKNKNGTRTDIGDALNEIRKELEQTKRNLQQLQLVNGEWEVIEPGLRDVYRQSRKRMDRALHDGGDEAFHKWRIRVKNLLYELELLEPVWPKQMDKLTTRLSKLQDKIGYDHDIAVLKGILRKTPERFGGTEAVERLIRCLDGKSRKLRHAAEPLGEKIFAKKPRRFVRKLGRRWSDWRR
jgi:CHAD domain-containing protein